MSKTEKNGVVLLFIPPILHVHVRNIDNDEDLKSQIAPYDSYSFILPMLAVTITALVFYGLIQKTLNLDQILTSA